MGWAMIFLALLPYFTGIDGQSAWTQPPSNSGSPAGTITLSCITTQSSHWIGWIQQKAGETPHFVHCDTCSNRGEGIPNRFTATRSGSTGTLTITNVQAEDEADYYCYSWNTAVTQLVFGGGTQLTVTGQPPKSPTVQVFAPSQEEVRSRNPYTAVCLLTDFHPPSFEVQWKRDNIVIKSGVETTKASKQGEKYVASSYLSMSAAEYENTQDFTCEVTHERKTITKTVSKSGGC